MTPETTLNILRSMSEVQLEAMLAHACQIGSWQLSFQSGSTANPAFEVGGLIFYTTRDDELLMTSVVGKVKADGYPEVKDRTQAWGRRKDQLRGWTWCEAFRRWLEEGFSGIKAFYIPPQTVAQLLQATQSN